MTNLEQQKDDPNYQLEELNKKADSLPDASKEEAGDKVDKIYAAQKERQENGKDGQSILGAAKNNRDFWESIASIDSGKGLDDVMKYMKATQKGSITHDTIRDAVKDPNFIARPGNNGKTFTLTEVYKDLISISKPLLENKIESSQGFAGANIDLQNTSYTGLNALQFVKDQSEGQGKERKSAVYNYIRTPLGDNVLMDDQKFTNTINGANGELRLDFHSIQNFEKSVPNTNVIFHLCKQKGEKIQSFRERFQKFMNDDLVYINNPIKLYDLPKQGEAQLKEQYPGAYIKTENGVTTVAYTLESIRSYLKEQKDNHYIDSFNTETETGTGSNNNNLPNINWNKREYMTQEYLGGKIFNKDQNLLLQSEAGRLGKLASANKDTLRDWDAVLAKNNKFKLAPLNQLSMTKTSDGSWIMQNGNIKKPVNDIGSIMDENDGYRKGLLYTLEKNPKSKNGNEYILNSYKNILYGDQDYRSVNFRGQRPTTGTFEPDQQKT